MMLRVCLRQQHNSFYNSRLWGTMARCWLMAVLLLASSAREVSGECINGLDGLGYEGDAYEQYCCSPSCSDCGGYGCHTFGDANECCVTNIHDLCVETQEAPCIMGGETFDGDSLVDVPDGAFTCDGPSYNDEICCSANCDKCGGSNCHLEDGGTIGCCVGTIREMGHSCDVKQASPCIIGDGGGSAVDDDGDMDEESTAESTTDDGGSESTSTSASCPGGIAGVYDASVMFCCSPGCGQCGGEGCGTAGTEEGDVCCTGGDVGNCDDTGAAPCLASEEGGDNGDVTDTDTTDAGTDVDTTDSSQSSGCPDGIDGILDTSTMFCCSPGCTQCGGSGCGTAGESEGDVCCTTEAFDSCDVTGAAPCQA